jgi:putative transposase
MPRPLRPIEDGLVYHVINRGNNRADVFHNDEDYEAFLESLADQKLRRPFGLLGYCLMPNHVHLLIRAGEAPISRVMQGLLVAHTQRYHREHASGGHVWQGRFKSPVVQDDEHILRVLRYIEANPLRAGSVTDAAEYRWSSFAAHGRGRADGLLDPIAAYDDLAGSLAWRRRRWSAYVHDEPDDDELAAVRRSVQTGLPYGDKKWVEKLGRRLGLDLEIRPRGRPRKVALATGKGGKVKAKRPR